MQTLTAPTTVNELTDHDARHAARIERVLRRRSYAVLASVSAAGRPHSAGVLYDAVGTTLYVNTLRSSRKGRNVAAVDRVGLTVPVRKLPVGPAFGIHFQARATVIAMDEPEILDLLDRGQLKKTSAHGTLDEPDGCFIRIEPVGLIHSYGIGVSLFDVIRDPVHEGARSVPA